MATRKVLTMNKASQTPLPIWRLGFRPFFLLAGIWAIVAMAAWLSVFLGAIPAVGAFNPVVWHAHEMLYGYATAVIAGFVLTASQNWTGRPGVKGRALQALVAIWLLGRVVMAFSGSANWGAAIVDLTFYPALAIAMIPYLTPEDMKVERVFFAYFALYLGGNLLMHLEAMNVLVGYGLRGAHLGLSTTVLMIIFMGGRVIPFFAESELSKSQPKTHPGVEIASHVTAWGFLATQLLIPDTVAAAVIAFAASAVHLARTGGWYVKRVRRVALLWVLYAAYLWIAIGFALAGLSSLGILAVGPSVHALTVGGLGAMTYGMMSRVALGHTGRRLQVSKAIIAGYALLNLAGVVRVLGPILRPAELSIWALASGTLWILAFAIFVLVYAPMLLAPRVDGRKG